VSAPFIEKIIRARRHAKNFRNHAFTAKHHGATGIAKPLFLTFPGLPISHFARGDSTRDKRPL
jgi:hypothetical protein